MGLGSLAQKNRKLVKLTQQQLQHWDQIKSNILFEGLIRKFTQNPELAKVLLMTQHAELWHGAPRTRAHQQLELEQVRTMIQQSDWIPLFYSDLPAIINTINRIDVQPKITGNSLVTLYGPQTYLIKGQYDPSTGQLYAPV